MATPKQLTRDGRMKMDPVFINGGKELVFTVQEKAVQMSLMRLNLADGSAERLHPQATASEFEPAYSTDLRYYTFVQSRGNLSLKMVIRDTKLNKDAVFDPGGGFAGMRRPSISPDNRRIVFSSPTATGQQIASVNLQGQDRTYLTRTSGINNWPAFSPDGKQIAFGSSRDGNFDLYVMNADGSDVRRLTQSAGLDIRPAWSPDGERLAFTSNRDGNYEIYIINADSSGLRRVTNHPERDDYPAWHPDGQHLVMVCERQGRFDLYLAAVPEKS